MKREYYCIVILPFSFSLPTTDRTGLEPVDFRFVRHSEFHCESVHPHFMHGQLLHVFHDSTMTLPNTHIHTSTTRLVVTNSWPRKVVFEIINTQVEVKYVNVNVNIIVFCMFKNIERNTCRKIPRERFLQLRRTVLYQ